jgi:hypothetical protein
MKFQLLHRAVKGTPVVLLNTVTRAIHIWFLARQIHNARILPTAVATRLAHLHRSLPAAACSSPAPPLPAWRRWRGHGYWCADVRPANLKTVDVDPSTPSSATTASQPPHATNHMDPAPSDHHENYYFIHDRGLSCLNLQRPLSHLPQKSAIYSCQCGIIRETCHDSSSLIDWLSIWYMDFVAPSLFE